jgi:hypothetical protein
MGESPWILTKGIFSILPFSVKEIADFLIVLLTT